MCLFLFACQQGGDLKKLNTDKQKQSYAIGTQMGKGIKAQGLDIDPKAVSQAISDVNSGKELLLSDADIQTQIMNIRKNQVEKSQKEAEKNLADGNAFLEKNKAKEGVKVTDSGLQYEVIEKGDEKAKPSKEDKVKVHYKGSLIDGTEFDSSYKRGTPAEFRLDQVIKAWTEAVPMMGKGGKWRLVVPPSLAYGERGRPGIPANSVLIFEIELLEIL